MPAKSLIRDIETGKRFRLGGAEFARRGEADDKPDYFWCEFQPGGRREGYYHLLYGYELVEVLATPLPLFLRGSLYSVAGNVAPSSRWYCHAAGDGSVAIMFTSESGVRKNFTEFRDFIERNDFTVKAL